MLFRYAKMIARCVVLTLLLSLGLPVKAVALAGSVALPFAASYTAPDGSSYTHRGIDVILPPGAEVVAPRAGKVRFAGRVPGPHGGSVLAVSLETAEGVITMLPLADVAVTTGDEVAAGRRVGACAETGDPSTSARHLHMGLKRGTVYVDPTVLLSAAPATETQPPGAPVAVPANSPEPFTAPAETGGSVPAVAVPSPSAAAATQGEAPRGASVQMPTLAAAGAEGIAPQGGSSNASQTQPDTAGSLAGLPAGVTLASAAEDAPTDGAPAEARILPGTRAGSPEPPALRATSSRGRLGRAALVLAALVAGAACFLVPLLITRRAVARRVIETPVSDRLGTMLQHL